MTDINKTEVNIKLTSVSGAQSAAQSALPQNVSEKKRRATREWNAMGNSLHTLRRHFYSLTLGTSVGRTLEIDTMRTSLKLSLVVVCVVRSPRASDARTHILLFINI